MSLFTKLVSRMRRNKNDIITTGRIEQQTSSPCSPALLTFTNDQGNRDQICLGTTPGIAEKVKKLLAQWRRKGQETSPQTPRINRYHDIDTGSTLYDRALPQEESR